MKKILVYVGVNNGGSFFNLIDNFDEVYGFEPIPELYNFLKEKTKNNKKINLYNCAVSDIEGKKPFYITNENPSSSLFEMTEEYRKKTGNDIFTVETIEVDCINLNKFLKEKNIHEIHTFISDAEGCDFTILKTIEELIKSKILKIFK